MKLATVTAVIAQAAEEEEEPGGCGWLGPGAITCRVGEAVAGAAADGFGQIAHNFITGFWSFVVEWLMTGWMKVDAPDLATSSAVNQAQDALRPIAAWMLFVGIVVACGHVIVTRRGDGFVQLARGLAIVAVITGLGVTITQNLLNFGDEYSDWILEQATDDDFGETMTAATTVMMNNPWGAQVAFIIGLLGIAAALFQVALMFLRVGFIAVFLAFLPILAAASTSKWSTPMFTRALSWTAALVLLKPVAATIYAVGFWSIGDVGDVRYVISGALVVMAATFVLPVLLKLFAPPIAAAITTGGGNGATSKSVTSIAQGGAVMASASGGRAASSGGGSGAPGGGKVQGAAASASSVVVPVTVAATVADSARKGVDNSVKNAAGEGG